MMTFPLVLSLSPPILSGVLWENYRAPPMERPSSKVPLVTNWPWPKIPVAGMDDWGRSEVKKMGETMGKSQLLMMINYGKVVIHAIIMVG